MSPTSLVLCTFRSLVGLCTVGTPVSQSDTSEISLAALWMLCSVGVAVEVCFIFLRSIFTAVRSLTRRTSLRCDSAVRGLATLFKDTDYTLVQIPVCTNTSLECDACTLGVQRAALCVSRGFGRWR